EALHRLLRTYLAHARQSLQQSGDLHLAEHLVLVGLLQHISEGRTAALEPLLELRAGATGGGGLLQRRSTLFLGELGKCHVFLRYYSKFWVGVATVPTPDLDSQCGGERGKRACETRETPGPCGLPAPGVPRLEAAARDPGRRYPWRPPRSPQAGKPPPGRRTR